MAIEAGQPVSNYAAAVKICRDWGFILLFFAFWFSEISACATQMEVKSIEIPEEDV